MSSHVANIRSRKAHKPASNPRRLKAESRQFFIDLQQSHISDNRDHNQYPVIPILDTSILSFASMMQHHAELMERAAALRDLKLLLGIGSLDFDKRHGFLRPTCPSCWTNLLRQCVTFCEHRQLKGRQPRFQLIVAKNSTLSSGHCFLALCFLQTKKSNWNFTVTGMSCLDRARTVNFGYTKFTAKTHSSPSLIHNSNIDPDDVRAGLWLPTQ